MNKKKKMRVSTDKKLTDSSKQYCITVDTVLHKHRRMNVSHKRVYLTRRHLYILQLFWRNSLLREEGLLKRKTKQSRLIKNKGENREFSALPLFPHMFFLNALYSSSFAHYCDISKVRKQLKTRKPQRK